MSIESHLGSTVHNTLEWIYKTILSRNPAPLIEQVIDYYAEEWQKNFNSDMKIVKDLKAKDYFNKGVVFLLDYYTKHYPFDDGTLECEKKVLIDIHGHTLQGFIDRLVHNKETDEYEIHDYKTASNLPTQEKINTDRQLALYSIAIQETFGAKKVCLTWHYLAHNKKICSYRTQEQIENLKREIKELIEVIESTTNFPAKKSALCDWCEYKSMCPMFGGTPDKTKTNQINLEKYPTAGKYIRD